MKSTRIIILTFLSITLFASCKSEQEKTEPEQEELVNDNVELAKIYENDQSDRMTDNINWPEVTRRDSLREVRVYEMLDSNLVVTSKDHYHAAMVFQHGGDSTAYKMAMNLMERSVELDSTANKWLLAAATDRYLQSVNKPQIYGTQYFKMGDEPWTMEPMDTTVITDEVRKQFNVETLAEQRQQLAEMNSENGEHLHDH
ncbi:hypothetical protein [Nonlabens ponticola]|uniref:Lipoprotein n=1 Tax=Nonlabens ponticola TaxID=2496866 RepID=A0A3S9MWK3_9FLAO|nr:hypothetical protein [Nonlabens ponticola]AZQ43591.1 hypothetical protein EJ995_04835 [Nonlabens ponticola]